MTSISDSDMRVLILHPDFNDPGGVAGYYNKLVGKFKVRVEHHIVGKRPGEKGMLTAVCRMFSDYLSFVASCSKGNFDIIHVNPSFDFKSFIRDGIYILLARVGSRKTVVFFRGWQQPFEVSMRQNAPWLFKLMYGRANAFIVLSEEFKRALEGFGCKQPIYREVTVFDDSNISLFDINDALRCRLASQERRIVFLSRIVRGKGIYETIDAVDILRRKFPRCELLVAGQGRELENVKKLARTRGISNVKFLGHVNGTEKTELLQHAHVLCFPTYYGEGLPNAVIEAMAFGIPVVTRPVGGIKDFFINGKHGFCSSSIEPAVYADHMEKLFNDQDLYRQISIYNHEYAKSNFMASQAALRLEKIYSSIVN